MSEPREPDEYTRLRAVVDHLTGELTGQARLELGELQQFLDAACRRDEFARSIIDRSLDAFVALDGAGRIIDWNARAEQLFGWSRDEVLGSRLSQFIVPPADREAHERGLARWLCGEAAGHKKTMTFTAMRRSGEEVLVEVTVFCSHGLDVEAAYRGERGGGGPAGPSASNYVCAFLHDLTRRRLSDEAIRQSESLYHSLVDHLPIHVLRKDLEGHIIYANRTFCELLGMTADQILGKTDYDFFPRELAEKYRADDRRVAETGQTFACVEENKTGDTARYFEVRKTAIRDLVGEVVATQAIFWDVTAREDARNALARERDLLRTLMDAIPDYIYVKDAQSRYVTANVATLRLLQADSPQAIQGKTNADFVSPELAAQYAADDRRVLDTAEPLTDREEIVCDPDGKEVCLLVSKVPLKDRQGRVTGLVGIDRDISNRKLMEEQLRAAKEAADAANNAKSHFLANMSHEIRTPMNAVLGITELLLDTPLDESQREYLQMVHESGESLMTLLNDILDFSKIEAGKLELDAAPFDLREMVGNTMKSLALRAHRKQLELACRLAPGVPQIICGDAGRLRQIIVNLTGNAIKFTDQGEVVLTVDCDDQNEEQATLHFQIRDSGIGIASDKLARIFDAFVQADSSTTRRFGGTGLGLAISVRLVELMGGRIWGESTLGQGSTFHFIVSLGRGARQSEPERPIDLTGLRVLAVDDNATNRRILQEILDVQHLEGRTVSSAAEALEVLERAQQQDLPYQLLLTDINMPDTDGFTLVRQVREKSEWQQPAIVALTSGVRLEDPARCRDLGISVHLMKPVKQAELLTAMARAVQREGVAIGPQSPAPRRQAAVSGLRILLAEDSLVNQKLAVGLLSKAGHDVTVVTTGTDAIAKWRQQAPELILMDLQMPEMDGLEATAMIRREERATGQRVPIVAMTAHAMKGDRQRCLDAGMDGYIAKPIHIDDVLAEIDRLWRRNRSVPGDAHEPGVP